MGLLKEMWNAFDGDMPANPSRRRFLRNTGVAIAGSGVAILAGGALAGEHFANKIKDDAEKAAEKQYPSPPKGDVKAAIDYRNSVKNDTKIDFEKLGKGAIVENQQATHNLAASQYKQDHHLGFYRVGIPEVATVSGILVGASGVGLALQMHKYKDEDFEAPAESPQTS